MTTFDVGDGRVLSYSRRGNGPLVVCVPGGPGMDPEAYFAGMDLPGLELLVLAPRGTGASSPPPTREGYRIGGYVEDVESLRVHLGLDRLRLYGNSHGGVVAMAYACRFAGHVERMVVTNAPSWIDEDFKVAAVELRERFAAEFPDGAERLRAADEADEALETELSEDEMRRQFRALMGRYVARQGPAETAYLDRLCAAPMNWESVDVMYEEMMGGLDALEGAERVRAPTLVIAGEWDVTVPPAAMRRVAGVLPSSTYLELSGVGHFVEVEAGEAFRDPVSRFLRAGVDETAALGEDA